MRIPLYAALIWVAVLCFYTFCLCGADKRAARRGDERVPEKKFFLLSILGGAAGLGVGMLVFRHKTRHVSFFFAVLIGCVLWCALLFLLAAACLM